MKTPVRKPPLRQVFWQTGFNEGMKETDVYTSMKTFLSHPTHSAVGLNHHFRTNWPKTLRKLVLCVLLSSQIMQTTLHRVSSLAVLLRYTHTRTDMASSIHPAQGSSDSVAQTLHRALCPTSSCTSTWYCIHNERRSRQQYPKTNCKLREDLFPSKRTRHGNLCTAHSFPQNRTQARQLGEKSQKQKNSTQIPRGRCGWL